MTILVVNTAKNRVDELTTLRVNAAYKEGKKDNLMYGIFNKKDEHDPSEAYATYATKKRAEEVVKEVIANLQKIQPDVVKLPINKLPNGFVSEYAELKNSQELHIITFPKE